MQRVVNKARPRPRGCVWAGRRSTPEVDAQPQSGTAQFP